METWEQIKRVFLLGCLLCTLLSCKATYQALDSLAPMPGRWDTTALIPLKSIKVFTPYPTSWSDKVLDLVFVGQDHPFYPQDNIIMRNNGTSLIRNSPYFELVIPFATGWEFLQALLSLTEMGYAIGNICIMGHSGYEGYFVDEVSGLHRNGYVFKRKGQIVPFSKEAVFVNELADSIRQGAIRLHPESVVVLAGCNTAYNTQGFAFQLQQAVNRPVIAATDKIDLYHVAVRGEDLKGAETCRFLLIASEAGAVSTQDFSTQYLRISQAIGAYKQLKGNQVKTLQE